jgi:hypothetical protein
MRAYRVIRAEVAVLPENDNNALAVQVGQAREQFWGKVSCPSREIAKARTRLEEIA